MFFSQKNPLISIGLMSLMVPSNELHLRDIIHPLLCPLHCQAQFAFPLFFRKSFNPFSSSTLVP